jgi:pimeloyl-ACP methyl ester carboxylesterase
MRNLRDNQQERTAFLPSADNQNTSLAIFVHGFEGSYLGTWGNLPSLLEQHADNEQPFAQWDYLFLGYGTGSISTYLDIAELICTRWRDAATGVLNTGRNYDRVALFGHSLGTLGIRQALCAWAVQPQGMTKALHSVTLFGSPLNGSPLARLAVWRDISDALKPNSPQLRMLRVWSKGAHTVQRWPVAKVVVGLDDRVVGNWGDFVSWIGDEDPITLTNLDHRALVKPKTWGDSSIVSYVRAALT